MSRAGFWTLHQVFFFKSCFWSFLLCDVLRVFFWNSGKACNTGQLEIVKRWCASACERYARQGTIAYPPTFWHFWRWFSFLPWWDMLVPWKVYQRHDVDVILTLNVVGWLGLKSPSCNYSKWDEGSCWQIWYHISETYIPGIFCDFCLCMSCLGAVCWCLWHTSG